MIPGPVGPSAPWQLNFDASYALNPDTGTVVLRLGSLTADWGGSAVYTRGTVNPAGVYKFTTDFRDGQGLGGGADGICLCFLDPATEPVTACSLPGHGSSCGGEWLNGSYLKIWKFGNSVSWEYAVGANAVVGAGSGPNNGAGTVQFSVGDGALYGIHTWVITIARASAGHYNVVIVKDGAPYVTWAACVAPDAARFGFTSGTGNGQEYHFLYATTFTGGRRAAFVPLPRPALWVPGSGPLPLGV